MGSRKNKRNNRRGFGDHTQNTTLTIDQLDSSYGGLDGLRDFHKNLNAHPISIFKIIPDASQPRRAVPGVVRANWQLDPGDMQASMAQLFTVWEQAVHQERGDTSFDLMAYLGQDEAEERTPESTDFDPQARPIEHALIRIADIALSVRLHGLTNPITVVARAPEGYTLETGERRWLAYHLLFACGLKTRQDGIEDDFSTIPARKVDQVDVWRQAAENGARDDLNAIARARQIAILTMNLHQQLNGAEFTPFGHFDHERDFYRQIIDESGGFLRVPRGTQDHILAAVGLKSGRQMSQYRKLLLLPPAAWDAADDFNLPEFALRSVVDNPELDEQAQVDAVWHLVEQRHQLQDNGTAVPVTPLANKPHRTKTDKSAPAPGSKAYFAESSSIFAKISPKRPKANARARERLEEMRRLLDEVEQRLNQAEQRKG